MTDILLDEDNDLLIAGGDFVVGESLIQEAGLILIMNQGELKSDALMGPNLGVNIRAVSGDGRAVAKAKMHLQRDNKNYEEVKNYIQLNGSRY